MKLKWLLAALLCVIVAVCSSAASLHTGTGTVSGQVLDVKCKRIAHAHVTLQASDGDQLQITETNDQGRFWFPFLPEGQYSVRASLQGRVSEWRQGIWVSPGRQTDVTLHFGPQKSNLLQ